MARRVFYSFHYKADNWRASKIRNIGAIEGNKPATDNDWETVTGRGDAAIEKWIKDQMDGRSCAVVLIGQNTAGRKWIDYEIVESWKKGMGLFGIHIHNITNSSGEQSSKGANPFASFNIDGTSLSSIVKTYDPPFTTSSYVYNHIADNIADWIDAAIEIRKKY
ncbi:MAG: TIR domain-containing protein [Acidobacteria bacterium]|nr:TIR domain-containing protein [Acidobacteriota bacterium]